MLYSRRHLIGNQPFLAHPFFHSPPPCPPHPSLGNLLPQNPPLSRTSELHFSVEEREPGLGRGLDGVSPQGKKDFPFKMAREIKWGKMGNCKQMCVCVCMCVCRYQVARATAWTKEILRGSLPKTAPIPLHNKINCELIPGEKCNTLHTQNFQINNVMISESMVENMHIKFFLSKRKQLTPLSPPWEGGEWRGVISRGKGVGCSLRAMS